MSFLDSIGLCSIVWVSDTEAQIENESFFFFSLRDKSINIAAGNGKGLDRSFLLIKNAKRTQIFCKRTEERIWEERKSILMFSKVAASIFDLKFLHLSVYACTHTKAT